MAMFARTESAQATWVDEIETRQTAVWVAVRPAPMNDRQELRTRAPRRERDQAGRVRPRVDWEPGADVW
jgi:hypothetical protein